MYLSCNKAIGNYQSEKAKFQYKQRWSFFRDASLLIFFGVNVVLLTYYIKARLIFPSWQKATKKPLMNTPTAFKPTSGPLSSSLGHPR